MRAAMSASCPPDNVVVPRKSMCSVACAMPGMVSSSEPTPYETIVVTTGARRLGSRMTCIPFASVARTAAFASGWRLRGRLRRRRLRRRGLRHAQERGENSKDETLQTTRLRFA